MNRDDELLARLVPVAGEPDALTPAAPARRLRRRERNYWADDDLRDVVQYPRLKPLPYLREVRLIERAQHGDTDARNLVWTHHLRLAMSVVNRFHVPRHLLADALQEAAIGLERAIMRFEVHRYTAFSTYAWFWIRQRVHRFLQYRRYLTPVPAHLHRPFVRFCVERARCDSGGAWLAWRQRWNDENADEYELMLSLFRLAHPERLSRRPRLSDPQAGPEFRSLRAEATRVVHAELDELPDRVRTVLVRRYGLDGQPERTLEEVAQEIGLTRERIRQIQEAAEVRLRNRLARHAAIMI